MKFSLQIRHRRVAELLASLLHLRAIMKISVPWIHALRNHNQFSAGQSLSCVWLFVTPWTAAHQASLSITNSWSLLKLMSIELVMPSSHLILCRPLLLRPSIFPSIRVFSSESVLHIRWLNHNSQSDNQDIYEVTSGVIPLRGGTDLDGAGFCLTTQNVVPFKT